MTFKVSRLFTPVSGLFHVQRIGICLVTDFPRSNCDSLAAEAYTLAPLLPAREQTTNQEILKI